METREFHSQYSFKFRALSLIVLKWGYSSSRSLIRYIGLKAGTVVNQTGPSTDVDNNHIWSTLHWEASLDGTNECKYTDSACLPARIMQLLDWGETTLIHFKYIIEKGKEQKSFWFKVTWFNLEFSSCAVYNRSWSWFLSRANFSRSSSNLLT